MHINKLSLKTKSKCVVPLWVEVYYTLSGCDQLKVLVLRAHTSDHIYLFQSQPHCILLLGPTHHIDCKHLTKGQGCQTRDPLGTFEVKQVSKSQCTCYNWTVLELWLNFKTCVCTWPALRREMSVATLLTLWRSIWLRRLLWRILSWRARSLWLTGREQGELGGEDGESF